MIDLTLDEQALLLGYRDMRIATLEKHNGLLAARLDELEPPTEARAADELAQRRAERTETGEEPPGA